MNAPQARPASTPPAKHSLAGSLPGTATGRDVPESYRAGRVRWLVRQAMAPQGFSAVLDTPDRFLTRPARLLANTELITLGVVPPLAAGTPPLLLRRLNYGRWRHRLRDVFRPTRAERAFKHGLALERAGIATPRVLAVGVQRCLRWPVQAYLVTDFVVDAQTLRACLTRPGGLPLAMGLRLADLVAQLHARGFSHRDLGAANILFDQRAQPCLIDLDGVRDYVRLPAARALQDLERLAQELATPGLRLPWHPARFLVRYCRWRGMESALRPWYEALGRLVQEHRNPRKPR